MKANRAISIVACLLVFLLVASPAGMAQLPNFTPLKPGTWSDAIVVARTTGTTVDSTNLLSSDTLYLDWAVTNKGPGSLTNRFHTALFVDGALRVVWSINPPFSPGSWTAVSDYSLGSLSTGMHTLRIFVDYTNSVAEADETDNEYTKTISIMAPPPVADIRITPLRLNINCTSTQMPQSLLLIENADSPEAADAAAFPEAGRADAASPPVGMELIPKRSVGPKPRHTSVDDRFERHFIHVKFNDGLPLRVRNGELTELGQGVLASARPVLELLKRGRWARVDRIEEQQLESMRQKAQGALGRAMPDLNVDFYLHLSADVDVSLAIDALNALDIVELAQPVPRPVEPPLPPDYRANQGYLNLAPTGVDALGSWNTQGVRGSGIRIIDVEYVFQTNHADLPPVTIVGPTPQFPSVLLSSATNHGTAILGELAALDNGWGISGTSPDAQLYFVGVYNSGIYDVAGALSTAISVARPGDVILLEQQTVGPAYTNSGDFGFVPYDWYKPVYDRIVQAVGLGITVVEAGANGRQDLDLPIYSSANNGHWPFLPWNDSGAILVGGGAVPASFGGSTTARSRLSYSNYGSTVDLQGWGERVWTLGYGDAYSIEGSRYYYTRGSGTSVAAPIVASACALLQSAFKARTAAALTPAEVTQLLVATGSAQQSGINPASQKIGPLPNVTAAILQSYSTQRSFTIHNDGNLTLNVTSMALDQATSWLSWSPSAPFAILPGASIAVTVTADSSQVPIGQTTRRLLVTSDDFNESPYPGGVFLTFHKNERPALFVRRSGDDVIISWTTNAVGFALQSTTNLSPPSAWVPVPSIPVIVGNENTVSTNLSVGTRYYRLRKP